MEAQKTVINGRPTLESFENLLTGFGALDADGEVGSGPVLENRVGVSHLDPQLVHTLGLEVNGSSGRNETRILVNCERTSSR
jgi:hypothetical protein